MQGMAQLRARRRLRVQVPETRLKQLAFERPNLMKTLKDEPDLVIEGAADVSVGFARIVTEVGGALCAEETALNSLAEAVGVHEQPNLTPRHVTGQFGSLQHRTADGSRERSSREESAANQVDDDDIEEEEPADGAMIGDSGDLESAPHLYPAAAGPEDETETFGLDRAQLRALLARKKGAVDDDGEVFRSQVNQPSARARGRIASEHSDPNATMSIALSEVQAAGASLAFSEIPDLEVGPVDDEELELFTDIAVPQPPSPSKKR